MGPVIVCLPSSCLKSMASSGPISTDSDLLEVGDFFSVLQVPSSQTLSGSFETVNLPDLGPYKTLKVFYDRDDLGIEKLPRPISFGRTVGNGCAANCP